MARPLRIEYEGAYYHVTSRGNERGKIFFNNEDYDKFKHYLKGASEKFGIILHAYVLMGNHYHLLIETPQANLSRAMHYINGSYTTYINIKKKRSGHLFQGRYKAIVVDRDSYLLELSRYIHLNPVRARMVQRPELYPYSSYNDFIGSTKDGTVCPDFISGMLSRKKKAARSTYRSFVESVIGKEIGSPLEAVYGGMVLGSTDFVKGILARIKNETLRKGEVSGRRELNSATTMEEVVEEVARHFKANRQAIFGESGNVLKKVAMYLIKRHSGVTNGQIGELFNLSYSGVAQVYRRFSKQLEEDKILKHDIARIASRLYQVKG